MTDDECTGTRLQRGTGVLVLGPVLAFMNQDACFVFAVDTLL